MWIRIDAVMQQLRTIKNGFIGLFFITIICLTSCKKDQNASADLPASLHIEPYIELLEINPLELQQFQEKIKIVLQYTDGDGDLGFLDPDAVAVFVKDSRLTTADAYHLPPLSPVGSDVPITGTVSIELKNTFLLGNATSEEIYYEIYIVDRAGHESNKVLTPLIKVLE